MKLRCKEGHTVEVGEGRVIWTTKLKKDLEQIPLSAPLPTCKSKA